MPTIRISGTLNISEIWNLGSSDADTLTIAVEKAEYRENSGNIWKPVSSLDGAYIVGSGAARYPVLKKGRMTARLQGIDAPELHYEPADPPKKWNLTQAQKDAFKAVNKKYRQPLGETAAFWLLEELRTNFATGGIVRCEAVSDIGGLEDLFDMYGRAIVEVIAKNGKKRLNINRKLVENGWAFPALYNSMSAKEIATFRTLGAKARKKNLGIWRHYSKSVGIAAFDPNLKYRKTAAFTSGSDAGAVIFPKLYRRQCTYWAYVQAGLPAPPTFAAYLRTAPDGFLLPGEPTGNCKKAATTRKLHDYLGNGDIFNLKPEDVIFCERPSTLKNAAGKKITGF